MVPEKARPRSGTPESITISDLPFSLSLLSGFDVSANPGFDFSAIPVPQAGSSKIVFTSNRDGNPEIYSMHADGSSLARLTINDFNDDHPRWSPDGAKILFHSDRDNPETGNADVYAMNTDGSGQIRLTFDIADDSSAVWSPDGSKITFQSLRNGQYYQIYVMNADGTNQVNISGGIAADYQPSWSPDGSKIAFASERDSPTNLSLSYIYVMTATGLNQTRLTFTSEPFRDEQPAWSRDATKIAFVSTRDSVLVTWQETDDEGGVLNRSRVDTNKEVYMMNADGSNQIRLTNILENDDSPEWSPNGTQMIFRSDRERECCDPADQVWLMNADGSNQINLSNNTFGDHEPSWSVNVNNTPPGENFPDAAQPVTINFDNLAAGTRVTNQYAQVKFSAFGHYGVVEEVLAWNTSGLGGSPFNALGGRFSPASGCYASPEIWLDFQAPVNNLSFLMLNMYALYYGAPYYTYVPYTAGIVDVYVNRLYYSTYNIDIPGQYRNPSTPLPINLSGIQGVTGIRITSTIRSSGPVNAGSPCQTIFYDDFTFTPDFDVRITNARVSGVLNETTQKALAGADIALNASVVPSNQTGGTYSWTFSGPSEVVGGSINSSSVTIRSTDTGTLTAKVSYTKNGFTASGTVTINAILPSLLSFTTQVATDQITRDQRCSGFPPAFLGAQYSFGCYQAGGPDDGIIFTAKAQIPSGQYLSNPAQSGIKIRQLISQFRKRVNDTGNGNIECRTVRSSQDQVDTGWQLDAEAMTSFVHTPPTFAQGNTLTYSAFDSPSDFLDSLLLGVFTMNDVVFVDDRFQTYVDYYVGDPLSPTFKRPLKIASENTYNFSYVGWKWNGQAIFGASDSLKYRLQFTNTPSLFMAGTNTLPALQGNVSGNNYGRCLGDPAPSTNMIDGARCFVKQLYWDFLYRAPDQAGWDFWLGGITQCAFDPGCINYRKLEVAKAFFFSGEFIQSDPEMANPPGTPNFDPTVYNRAFVRHCYNNFLRRAPDQAGWDHWTGVLNSNGNYNEMINAFIVSIEYRDRPFALPGMQVNFKDFHPCP